MTFGSAQSNSQPSASGTGFGGMSFGSQQQTAAFGGGGGFGSGIGLGQSTNGTGNPAFVPPQVTETLSVNGRQQKLTNYIEVITAMPQYENKTLEELRLEDYSRNNKGPSTVGAFGQGGISTGGGLFGQANKSCNYLKTSEGFKLQS